MPRHGRGPACSGAKHRDGIQEGSSARGQVNARELRALHTARTHIGRTAVYFDIDRILETFSDLDQNYLRRWRARTENKRYSENGILLEAARRWRSATA